MHGAVTGDVVCSGLAAAADSFNIMRSQSEMGHDNLFPDCAGLIEAAKKVGAPCQWRPRQIGHH